MSEKQNTYSFESFDRMIEQAHKDAEAIRQHARQEAERQMTAVLKQTGTWVDVAHKQVNPVVRMVQKRMCVEGTRGRIILDTLLGHAKECYCCAALRGYIYGAVTATVLFLVLHLACAH